MTAVLLDAPTTAALVPTNDPQPVQQAVIDGIISTFEPETHLIIVFRLPDGGVKAVRFAWTAGGEDLGDLVDREAVARGFDLVDGMYVPARYRSEHVRGRVTTQAYPLRPILADVLNGRRATEAERASALGIANAAADMKGQDRPVPDFLGQWGGVGPAMLNRQWVQR